LGAVLLALAFFFIFITINIALRRYQQRKNQLLC
jgi:hypothetical protein